MLASLCVCVCSDVTSHAGSAHSVISEAKFSLEPPTNVTFQY